MENDTKTSARSPELLAPPESESESEKGSNVDATAETPSEGQGWRFWAIFTAMSITSWLTALDASILGTALPTISASLKSDSLYVWTINSYFITATAVQPLFGQSANVFGRRALMVTAILAFTAGSAIAGAANSPAVLILGRSFQGVGGGGVNMMVDMIVCDLVSQRERPKYMGLIFAIFGIGTTLGPVLGGVIVENTSWRWIFFINIPICVVALMLIVLFLRVKYKKDNMVNKLKRIDYSGNVLLMGSVISVLLGLVWGGSEYRWSSYKVLVPLILGFLGMGAFILHQKSSYVKEPTMPLRLFSNRTSAIGFILTFLHAMLMYWVVYFLPVYFQAVKQDSASKSGVNLLPTVTLLIPGAIIAGVLITVTGFYRPIHYVGFGLMAIGFGLFSMMTEKSGTALWVIFQLISALGQGLLLTSTLPAIQAPLPESDVATSTATWAFVRSFGSIWGVAIPSTIFNTRINSLLHRISDPSVRSVLANGGAYESGTRDFISSFNARPELQKQIISVFVDALKLVWQVGIGFSLVAIPIALIAKDIALRKELETEFGLENEKQKEAKSGV